MSSSIRPWPLLVILAATATAAHATIPALNAPTTVQATRLDAPIEVDGHLEEAWLSSTRIGNFAEFSPTHLVEAVVPTEGYVAHSPTDLYVAFVCHDPQIDRLRASLTDRDQIFGDDFVGLAIDTYRDQQRAYEFFSNPHGVQGDMLWHASRAEDDDGAIWQAHGGEDSSFDAVWESAGRIYDDRWVVEMRIPLSALRYPSRSDQDWGVHFVRVYPREDRHQFSWMPISQDNNSFMGQAGGLALTLDSGANSAHSLELMPYLSGSRTDQLLDDGTGRGAWRSRNGGPLNAAERLGFTGKYTISSAATVDFAYRPDFSQIESDAGRVDVNQPWAFFYQERRPFFMEGSDIFQVDTPASGMVLDVANLIYTRSINDPSVAAKTTGKVGKISYGYIAARDDNTPLILPLADGTIVRATSENSWSNIVRGKVEVAEQSHVGFAATNRRFDQGGHNTAAMVETNLRLSHNYTLSALGAATYTREPDDEDLSAIIPDLAFEVGDKTITADFDGQGFGGYVLKTSLIRQSRAWNFNLSYQDYSPGFRADNSAIFSNDGRLLHTQHTYSVHLDDHAVLNQVRPGAYVWRKTDYEGDVKDTGIRPSLLVAFKRQTFLNLGGFLYNREKFGGVKFGDARAIWGYLGTNAFEKISGVAFINRSESINRFGVVGSAHNPSDVVPTYQESANLTLRPTDKVTARLDYDSTRLWTRGDRELIVRQRILHGSLQYHVSKQVQLRLVGELGSTRRALAVEEYDNSRSFSLEPLVSYKLNPFTVFYLGGSWGGSEDPYRNHRGLSLTDQTIFTKFQYLYSVL